MLKTRLGSNAMRDRCLQSSDDGLDPCQARQQWSNWNISTCRLAASTARFIGLLLDLPEPVGGAPSPAICSGLPVPRCPAILSHGQQVTRDHLRRIRRGGGRAGDGSTQAGRPAGLRDVERAHARLSGTGAAISRAGRCPQRRVRLSRSEMSWLCNTHQTVALDIVRRSKATPVHELERYMRCKDCSQVRGYPFKRSHLVALRPSKFLPMIRRRDLVAGRAVGVM